jgi:LuxR family transcriptional regulator, maltose regulon positive regulatory protein
MATHAAGQVVTSFRQSETFAGDPILAAKITAPDVPEWALRRPRVSELVASDTRGCPLTVVTGPAGAGKTMALAMWAEAQSPRVAWVCLDEYDNRPGVFWSYAVAALRRSGVPVPRTLSPVAPEQPAEHVFLPRLTATLAAQNPPVTLIVDDFHLLTEPRVLNGLDYLLRNAGTGLRLVVSARAVPPLLLNRYRLAGTLTEIGAGDLAFSRAEVGQLLARHGCELSAESLERLTRETEGWAAGLRLAALSMTAHPDPDQLVRELVTEESALTGYLVGEVLDTQPPPVREVLLRTSILERVNAPLASELTGNRQAGRVLAALAQANAFVEPIGGGWYRYHKLFAEMLRLELGLESPDRTASLHRQAARWYQRNGQLIDAARHAAEGGDWQLAASLVTDKLREVDDLLKCRPGLGTLVDRAEELRLRLAKERASVFPGAPALTPAEFRLLPALCTHLSLPEIADEMFLSAHTIRTQCKSIYRKLGVAGRSQAVTRARELGLLDR